MADDDEVKEAIQKIIDRANRLRRDDPLRTGQMRAQGEVDGKTFVARAGESVDAAFERWKRSRES